MPSIKPTSGTSASSAWTICYIDTPPSPTLNPQDMSLPCYITASSTLVTRPCFLFLQWVEKVWYGPDTKPSKVDTWFQQPSTDRGTLSHSELGTSHMQGFIFFCDLFISNAQRDSCRPHSSREASGCRISFRIHGQYSSSANCVILFPKSYSFKIPYVVRVSAWTELIGPITCCSSKVSIYPFTTIAQLTTPSSDL